MKIILNVTSQLGKIGQSKIAVLLQKTEENYSISSEYLDAVIKAGGAPVLVSHENVLEQLKQISPDGILLPGGVLDLPAHWYDINAKMSFASEWPLAYWRALQYAKENKLPTFGIGTGMQIMAVYLDGMLTRKATRLPLTADHNHNHGVYIAPDTLLYKIVQKKQITVNSMHDEAVAYSVKAKIAAAEVSTIEAIEPIKPWSEFVLGVQWHPERLKDEASGKLFKAFVESCW